MPQQEETPKKRVHKPKEWGSITAAERILGINRADLIEYINDGLIPFRKRGSHYTLNIKLVRAYLCRMDIHNMERIKAERRALPLAEYNRTKKVDSGARQIGRIRRVEE